MSSPTAPTPARAPREGVDPGGQVRRLSEREKSVATWLLARAFRDNPLNVAVIGGGARRRLRANVHGMRALMATPDPRPVLLGLRVPGPRARGGPPGSDDAMESGASLAGVLFGVPPHAWPLESAPLGVQVLAWLGQGPVTVSRWSQVYRALEEIHPMEPHWYLGVLGVEPERQHAGHGTALLRSWLERVDEENEASYLETDRAENVGFYRRQGFEVVNDLRVLGVPVWCMWRDPR